MAAAGSRQASLILRLVDEVSRPAAAISGALRGVNGAINQLTGVVTAPARVLRNAGRSFRRHSTEIAGASVPLAMGLGKAAESVYGFEKAGNRMEAFGLLTDEQRARLEDEAQFLNKFFPQTNKGIIEAAAELFRAGLSYEQALGALKGTLQLSLAGDIATERAADIATNIMYAMKLPMETYEQVQTSLQRVNDLLAYGASKSNTDIALMSDTFRYVAPLAATAGMKIEEVTALTMELAKAGIKGAEAGVALRSALVRMAKPTKPMLAAFSRLNIDMKDFVKYKERIEASSIVASLLPDGYDLSDLSGEIQAILDDKALGAAPQRMIAQLSDLIVGAIGDESVRDTVSSSIADAVLAGAQEVDLVKLLGVLRDKGATITDIAQIFDVRMGSRLAAILYNDLDAVIEDVTAKYEGTAAKMAKAMTKGIVGVVLELEAALENMAITLAESGVLETVSKAMEAATDFLTELSKSNPKLLEFGTYAAMALAAAAPLGWALSGVASALALAANPITLIAGALGYLAYQNWDSVIAFGEGFKLGFLDNLDPNTIAAFESLASQLGGWLGEIDAALSDSEGWGKTGEWFGSDIAKGINWLVRDIQKLKEELQGLRDWWDSWGWGDEAPASRIGSGSGVSADDPTGLYKMLGVDPGEVTPSLGLNSEQLASEARQAAARAKQELDIVAYPKIDTSSIDAAIEKAGTFRRMLEGMGSVSSGAPASSTPAYGGPRAEGGAVRRGLAYTVGEEGTEVFAPKQNGTIIPNHALRGGGSVINNTFNITGADPKAVAKEIGNILDRQLERSRQLSLDDRPVLS